MTHRVRGKPDARSISLEAILNFDARGSFVVPAIDQIAAHVALLPGDRGLARELACGVIRRRMTLEAVLAAYSFRSLDDLDPEVQVILLLGIYQLLFLDRIPPHAALHETVELCHRIGMRSTAGFVNGILRSLHRELPAQTQKLRSISEATEFTVPAMHVLRNGINCEGISLGRQVFADPLQAPGTWLAEAFSLPDWLVERWMQTQTADEVFNRGAWFATSGTDFIRVNLLRATSRQCLDVLQAAGLDAQPGHLPESIAVCGSLVVDKLPGFAQGWFSVQDESAMSAVDLLNPQPGEHILDLCAAPGGKTSFLAERMMDTGSVTACETSGPRLHMIRAAIERLCLTNVSLHKIRHDGIDIPQGPFDAALVDVPCSNTGVLGKRPEARWRTSPESLKELLPLQQRLLADAMTRVRPGGRVVYSTCSIEPEENERVVERSLQEHPDCRLMDQRFHQPGQPADGAYQALIAVGVR